MEDENYEYTCEKCSFVTTRISHWNRHISTKKHKILCGNVVEHKKQIHYCKHCQKAYKHRSSMLRHQTECGMLHNEHEHTTTPSPSSIQNQQSSSDITQLTGLVHTLLQENKELQKKLVDVTNEPKIINNNTFNMMNFLNNECKNALNFTDFITNIKITFTQLEDTARMGYLHGIEDAFISEIKKLKHHERPIHCTDLKRFTFYLKDDDEWNKKTGTDEINKALGTIVNKQFNCLQQWKIDNPDWYDNQSKYDKYVDIMAEITKGDSMSEGNKMKRKAHKIIGQVCKFEK